MFKTFAALGGALALLLSISASATAKKPAVEFLRVHKTEYKVLTGDKPKCFYRRPGESRFTEFSGPNCLAMVRMVEARKG